MSVFGFLAFVSSGQFPFHESYDFMVHWMHETHTKISLKKKINVKYNK